MAWFLLVALFGLQSRAAETGPPDTIHSHEWAVRFEPQANVTFTQLADELAVAHGLINLGQVGPLEDVYHFMPTHLCHPTLHKAPKCWTRRKRRTAEDPSLHQRLDALPQVAWVEQQKVFRRHRRSVSKRGPEWSEDWEDRLTYTDPLYKDQWHLHNQGNDIHQGPTWLQGFTGRGVVVTVVDDGIEHNHPDLESNYDPEASYDLNSDDPDPQPRYSPSNINKHGTRCAGEIAAVANNQYCGVGVAYEAKVGGVRLIDGDVTDVLESRALGLNPQHISIYSSSWGPEDDGRTVEGPGPLVRATLLKGVREGRGGKGSIYVFAGGNGMPRDNCNCDGYTNSIYTISIGAVDMHNGWPWYSEPCSATVAVTYSSGGQANVDGIRTTDLHLICTSSHTGTSAAAPLAAGIFALVLQASPQTTWRDLQHLVIATSKLVNPSDDSWAPTGTGRKFSHKFGFGLIDTTALVKASMEWDTVGPQLNHTAEMIVVDKEVADAGCIYSSVVIEEGKSRVKFLEHVTVNVTITHQRRGDLEVFLLSPCGTRSQLLTVRYSDADSKQGFRDWVFMTVASWGENPVGEWRLGVRDTQVGETTGRLVRWQLTLWGTERSCEHPTCTKDGTRPACKRDHGNEPCPPPPPPPSLFPWLTNTSLIIIIVVAVVAGLMGIIGAILVVRFKMIDRLVSFLESLDTKNGFRPLAQRESDSAHELSVLDGEGSSYYEDHHEDDNDFEEINGWNGNIIQSTGRNENSTDSRPLCNPDSSLEVRLHAVGSASANSSLNGGKLRNLKYENGDFDDGDITQELADGGAGGDVVVNYGGNGETRANSDGVQQVNLLMDFRENEDKLGQVGRMHTDNIDDGGKFQTENVSDVELSGSEGDVTAMLHNENSDVDEFLGA